MEKLYKYEKNVIVTYFKKLKKVNIDEINENSLVYLKINSPLNYGVRNYSFYGKILKKTDDFFYILLYCDAITDNWNTKQILLKENNKNRFTKRWSKKRIIELYLVDYYEKTVKKEFYTSNIKYSEK